MTHLKTIFLLCKDKNKNKEENEGHCKNKDELKKSKD